MANALEALIRQAGLLRQLGSKRRRRREAPRANPPRGTQLRFERALRELIKEASGVLRSELKPTIESAVRAGEVLRQDSPADELRRLQEQLAQEFGLIFSEARIRRLAERMLGDVEGHNRRQVQRQLRSILGIDIFADTPALIDVLSSSVDEAVAIVTKWSFDFQSDVASAVRRGVRQGLRFEQIAAELQQRLAISQRRARLIARDQVSNANAALTRQRQTDAGITRYRWITSLDERVRDDHAGRHGEIFSWDNPPSDGHPGEAINCRCTASPVLE